MANFEDTSLNDIAKLGGMGPAGAGSFGGTLWTVTTLVSDQWIDTSLNDVAKLGGMSPAGAGSFGATVWDKTMP